MADRRGQLRGQCRSAMSVVFADGAAESDRAVIEIDNLANARAQVLAPGLAVDESSGHTH